MQCTSMGCFFSGAVVSGLVSGVSHLTNPTPQELADYVENSVRDVGLNTEADLVSEPVDVNSEQFAVDTGTSEAYNVIYDSLFRHIEGPEESTGGRIGIKGTHNKNHFVEELTRIGAEMVETKPSSQMAGIETITYRMPKKDKYGQPTGEFQSKTHQKTVYDPAQIETEAYIMRGLQAAEQAASITPDGHLGREWSGIDKQGVVWHGYCDNNGSITSFYPEE